MSKRAGKLGDNNIDEVQDWENHIILRVPEDCVDRLNKIALDEAQKGEEVAINVLPDLRHAQIRLGNRILSGKFMDLPCVNEVYKTLDKKNVYKVADLNQILVCSHDVVNPNLASTSTSSNSTSSAAANDPNDAKIAKKEARQWHYPHGLTPPMKSARRRRFRKTKKKKYMDAPEVEKELKKLLRADLEADSVRWEIVEDKKNESAQVKEENITETALFGDNVSSSEEEEDE
ncbi:unnamed protein product [Caenorhabditis angaria]|uniref:TAFII55 protein conserved region domain-containing protein n=1 Tax=Caenorhabditis angaria TaxID=860376 RepID=A0A9P1IIX8_9PELO|nr:unnamed protein product [Caenorhabditis angaria]